MKKLLLLLLTTISTLASAAHFDVIIPFTPGGGADISFRHFQKYASMHGTELIPQYKGGANGLIGMNAAATGDRETTVVFGTLATVAAHRAANPNYQFTYISMTHAPIMAFVAGPNNKLQTYEDLENELKVSSTRLSFGHGSPNQQLLLSQLFTNTRRIDQPEPLLIGYKGAAPAMMDVISGHVDVAVVPMSIAVQSISSGNLKLLAIISQHDTSFKVPRLNKKYKSWRPGEGFLVVLPQGASLGVIQYWNRLLREYLDDEQTKKYAADAYLESVEFGPNTIIDGVVPLAAQLRKLSIN